MIVVDLHLSFTIAGVLTGLPLLLMGATGLPGGWLTDRWGARQIMIVCLAGVTVADLVRGLAVNEALLLAGTILLGLTIGTLQPALPRVARDTLPHRTALATAIYFNGLVIGGAAGVALTPFLAEATGGWRGALVLWAAVGAVATIGWLALRSDRAVDRHSGALRLEDIRDAFRLPGMIALTIAMGTQSAIFYTFSAWVPTYLVSRGWSLTSATLPIASLPIASIICSPLVVPLEVRFGRRVVIGLSGALVAVGLLVFLLWPDQMVLPCAITIGIGTTWAFGVCLAAPAALAPARRVGLTAGVLLAVGYAESTIGPIAIGSLRDLSGSYEVGWLLMLGLAIVLAGTAIGIPGRLSACDTPDQMQGSLER